MDVELNSPAQHLRLPFDVNNNLFMSFDLKDIMSGENLYDSIPKLKEHSSFFVVFYSFSFIFGFLYFIFHLLYMDHGHRNQKGR